MISIQKLTFQYKDASSPALRDINLVIPDGDFLGITGTSGAGKSTLTHAINGIVPHRHPGDFYGCVTVDGMDTVEVRPEQISALAGSVFQDIDAQMVSSAVEDELLFGLENFGVPKEQIGGRIDEALFKVGISPLRERSLSTLSGGQKQKVAIAAIVALRPKTILLDEPTGELDPQSSRQIFEMLRELNEEQGITIVIVEQKIMLLCEFARRLAVMHEGSLLFCGGVREVLQNSGELRRIGVNVPRVVSLKERLAERGLYNGPVPLNLNDAHEMMKEALA